jgi:hypothetical protein
MPPVGFVARDERLSRLPAGVSKPNALCHVAWPEKLD